MNVVKGLMVSVLSFALAGCAGMQVGPTPDEKQSLAPTGKLRVGLYKGGPTSVVPGATPEENKGVGYDIGRELANRLGVPFEPVIYPSPGGVVGGAGKGEWDIGFLALSPERMGVMDFTKPFLIVEHGYLAPAGSVFKSEEDVDKPGVRIGVPDGGSIIKVLEGQLKHATMVKSKGLAGGLELLKAGEVDVFAANKANLHELSDKLPGSSVLPGRLDVDKVCIVAPKGREAGMKYAQKFIDSAKADGLVQAAVKRANLRGSVDE